MAQIKKSLFASFSSEKENDQIQRPSKFRQLPDFGYTPASFEPADLARQGFKHYSSLMYFVIQPG